MVWLRSTPVSVVSTDAAALPLLVARKIPSASVRPESWIITATSSWTSVRVVVAPVTGSTRASARVPINPMAVARSVMAETWENSTSITAGPLPSG